MIKQLLSISVILTLVACASQPRIESDKDIEYDLSSYQSFKIEEPELTNSPSQIGLNPILVQRVERAIKSRASALASLEPGFSPAINIVVLDETLEETLAPKRINSSFSWLRAIPEKEPVITIISLPSLEFILSSGFCRIIPRFINFSIKLNPSLLLK